MKGLRDLRTLDKVLSSYYILSSVVSVFFLMKECWVLCHFYRGGQKIIYIEVREEMPKQNFHGFDDR